MRMNKLFFAIAAACLSGLFQAVAATPAETAAQASAQATAFASQAAANAAKGHEQLDALNKGIAAVEAQIKDLQTDTNLLAKAQAELAQLMEAKTQAEAFVAKLDAAAAKAAAAAAAAQEALGRATAEGVSEADAQAAAGQALRQARFAEQAAQATVQYLNLMYQSIQGSGFAELAAFTPINDLVTLTITNVTSTNRPPVPQPGPTPTQIGRGRRGV